MTTLLFTKEQEQPVKKVLPVEPSLLITMPFAPILNTETTLRERVTGMLNSAEKLLYAHYSIAAATGVLERLNKVFRQVNFNCFRKSIGAFISASTHKLFYLDLKLRQDVQLTSSFHVSDLLQRKEQNIEYLVLILSDRWAKTYYGNQSGFKLVKTDRPRPFADVKETGSYTIENRRMPVPGSLYRQVSHDFSLLANAYDLPVFLIGSVKNVNHFRQVVKSTKDIVHVIYANPDYVSEPVIFRKLTPYFLKWNSIKQLYLRRQLDEANRLGLVSYGLKNITGKTTCANGTLLMIEEHNLFADSDDHVHLINSRGDIILTSDKKNEVNGMIESFLENGGDVEVMPDEFLKDYDSVAWMNRKSCQVLSYTLSSGDDRFEIF